MATVILADGSAIPGCIAIGWASGESLALKPAASPTTTSRTTSTRDGGPPSHRAACSEIRPPVRSRFTQDLRPGSFSAVPSGLIATGDNVFRPTGHGPL